LDSRQSLHSFYFAPVFYLVDHDEIEVVHIDALAYIALADATADWQHRRAQCLSGKDILGYDFLNVTKDGFVPMTVQLASKACLGDIVFQ
jgi:hypothetical protein